MPLSIRSGQSTPVRSHPGTITLTLAAAGVIFGNDAAQQGEQSISEILINGIGWYRLADSGPVDQAAVYSSASPARPRRVRQGVHVDHYLRHIRSSLSASLDVLDSYVPVRFHRNDVGFTSDHRAGCTSGPEPVLALHGYGATSLF